MRSLDEITVGFAEWEAEFIRNLYDISLLPGWHIVPHVVNGSRRLIRRMHGVLCECPITAIANHRQGSYTHSICDYEIAGHVLGLTDSHSRIIQNAADDILDDSPRTMIIRQAMLEVLGLDAQSPRA